jgi:hypothetical protein
VWLVSEEILDEYKVAMKRLGARRHLIGNIISLLREEAEFVKFRPRGGFPNPADDAFCACAGIGITAFIVTLNPRDFRKRSCGRESSHPGCVAYRQVPLITTFARWSITAFSFRIAAEAAARVSLARLRAGGSAPRKMQCKTVMEAKARIELHRAESRGFKWQRRYLGCRDASYHFDAAVGSFGADGRATRND